MARRGPGRADRPQPAAAGRHHRLGRAQPGGRHQRAHPQPAPARRAAAVDLRAQRGGDGGVRGQRDRRAQHAGAGRDPLPGAALSAPAAAPGAASAADPVVPPVRGLVAATAAVLSPVPLLRVHGLRRDRRVLPVRVLVAQRQGGISRRVDPGGAARVLQPLPRRRRDHAGAGSLAPDPAPPRDDAAAMAGAGGRRDRGGGGGHGVSRLAGGDRRRAQRVDRVRRTCRVRRGPDDDPVPSAPRPATRRDLPPRAVHRGLGLVAGVPLVCGHAVRDPPAPPAPGTGVRRRAGREAAGRGRGGARAGADAVHAARSTLGNRRAAICR